MTMHPANDLEFRLQEYLRRCEYSKLPPRSARYDPEIRSDFFYQERMLRVLELAFTSSLTREATARYDFTSNTHQVKSSNYLLGLESCPRIKLQDHPCEATATIVRTRTVKREKGKMEKFFPTFRKWAGIKEDPETYDCNYEEEVRVRFLANVDTSVDLVQYLPEWTLKNDYALAEAIRVGSSTIRVVDETIKETSSPWWVEGYEG